MSQLPPHQPLLSARFSVRYGNKPPVLREVEIAIQPGEVLGLVGQSGSGKSTLAMAMSTRCACPTLICEGYFR